MSTPNPIKTALVKYLCFFILAAPSVCLGWVAFDTDSVWLATLVTFWPLIVGWYLAKKISTWYAASYSFTGLMLWLAVANLTEDGFVERFMASKKRIDAEYIQKFLNDPAFYKAVVRPEALDAIVAFEQEQKK